MEAITVRDLLTAVGGTLIGPETSLDRTVSSVDTDSRDIHPGSLFLPLVGERFDGHTYIGSALEAGAAGCLTAREPEHYQEGRFYIKVEDTQRALRDLAFWYKEQFRIPFVGVTGSVGKTTAKDMIASVLSVKYKVLKTEGNFNNNVGLPLTLLRLDRSVQIGVVEMGMDRFGEIDYLGDIVRPEVGVITNIGDAHIEYLGSREGILKAKCEIFDHLKENGLAVLNGDDALLDTVTLPQRIVRCGQSEHCQVRIHDIVDHGVDGITCTVTTPKDTYAVSIPAPGEHMAYSASMAVAVGEELGLSREEIIRGVAAYEPTGSRMHVIRMPEGRVLLDDCYNANPQSVTAALEVLGRTDCERRVAVLGDMGELGDLTDQAHYNMGALAAMLGIDFLVAIGPKAVKIADGAAQSGGAVLHFSTKEEALQTVKEQLQPNTSMLIKASHSMRFERLTEDLRKYYD